MYVTKLLVRWTFVSKLLHYMDRSFDPVWLDTRGLALSRDLILQQGEYLSSLLFVLRYLLCFWFKSPGGVLFI